MLAVAVPLAWVGATPITSACDDTVASSGERDEFDSHTSIWPPGVRCVVRRADGMQSETTYVTWYELTIALLSGFGVWLSSAAMLRVITSRQLVLGVAGAILVFLAASGVFFA